MYMYKAQIHDYACTSLISLVCLYMCVCVIQSVCTCVLHDND